MSLYIPGFDMPEDCTECPCNDGEGGLCMAIKPKRRVFIDKPDWCPLIEITEIELNTFIEGRIETFNIPETMPDESWQSNSPRQGEKKTLPWVKGN